MTSAHNPNRSLVRIFCLSLSGLLAVYASIAVYGLFQLENVGAAELATGLLRIALGAVAVGALFRWGWYDEPLESQVRSMGASFELDYANLSTRTKIRLIVLVTMLSLLLELVMIRWLASVFPVYSFYKNFTMLACFLGLGAGYAVAEKQPCAPALVLPMLALFVGVITLLRYDTGSASAPIVIAKGRDYLALRIRTLAETHGVPLVENPPLAQALFKSAPLNAEIPPHFYRAVAEVLAYVFQVLTPESRLKGA